MTHYYVTKKPNELPEIHEIEDGGRVVRYETLHLGVGGYIEPFRVQFDKKSYTIWLDEDGLGKVLPVNLFETSRSIFVVGPVVVTRDCQGPDGTYSIGFSKQDAEDIKQALEIWGDNAQGRANKLRSELTMSI